MKESASSLLQLEPHQGLQSPSLFEATENGEIQARGTEK